MPKQIQDRLAGYKVYGESGEAYGTADITLPDLEYMTETIKGAGLMGETETINAGNLSAMGVTLNWATVNEEQVKLTTPAYHTLQCYGAMETQDPSTNTIGYSSVRISMRVLPKKLGLGTFDSNAKTGTSMDFSVTYIKIDIDGATKLELDPLNYILTIDGKDYAAEIRKALGMN